MEESKINENNDHQELDLDDVAEVKKMKSKEFIPDSLIKNVIIRSKEDSQIEIKKIQEMNRTKYKKDYINLECNEDQVNEDNLSNSTAFSENNIISIKESDIVKETNIEVKNYYYENMFSKAPCKLGNCYTLFWFRGNPLIVIGPHWPFFVCLNFFILSISISYFYFLWDYIYEIPRNIGFCIFVFQTSCYWFTALSNPGIPIKHHMNNKNLEDLDKKKRICRICNIMIDVDKNMVHCEDCGLCVEGYDHHCPWTTKCIGKKNLYSFYGFILGTLALFFYLIFGMIFLKTNKF